MFKKYTPTYYAKNIYEIDINFFLKLNLTTILIDLDNTLEVYDVKKPSKITIEFIKKLKSHGLEPVIISNNKKKRVEEYSKELNVKCIYSAMKPFSFKIKNFLKQYLLNNKNVILIGDQTVTDIKAGNGAKIITLLCDKLCEKDQPTTRFNRIFDKIIRKYLIKNNKLNYWKGAI